MKKPAIKKPGLKRPEMKTPATPQVLENLYRDLRDRRLLLPLAGLLVALIAVPMLIKQGGSEPPVAPDPAAISVADATAVSPVVLAEQSGIRNYKKRLADLKETDPFAAKFKPKKPTDGGPGDAPAAAAGPDTALESDQVDALNAEATATTSVSSVGGSTPAPSGGSSTPPSDVSPVDTPPQQDDTTDDSADEIRFFSAEIDVEVGEIGHVEAVDNVRYLDYLPGKATPVITFLGFGDNTDEAIFLVSPNVTELTGEGDCAPKKPAPCQFLTMKTGDTEKFLYGNQSKAFSLRLLDIRVVEVADPRMR